MSHSDQRLWKFWIDRGGTFTDVVAKTPTGDIKTHKLLSENPRCYPDASIAGIRHFLAVAADAPILVDRIGSVRMGTTVATNALLERKGVPTALVTSMGFRDAIRIAYQQRPDLFDLNIRLPDMLYQTVVEAPERIDAKGQDILAFDLVSIEASLKRLRAEGFDSVAVVLMHSYEFPQHEIAIGQIAEQLGFAQVSLSHEVSPLIKLVSRGDTTLVEAYLAPILQAYLDGVESELPGVDVKFMQSSGGLVNAGHFRAKDSILSGPAGGIVGAASVSQAAGFSKIVTFDMGGTSTDVAHYAGHYERSYETVVAGVRMRVPMMEIDTIAAGGGSIIKFHQGRLQVGPESAGALPGPACYRLGGPLTVTDCNVMLGKVNPDFFPKVFGEDNNQAIDVELVKQRFTALAQKVSTESGVAISAEAVAEGCINVALDNMANAIKKVSVQKGHDILGHTLCSFGAAAGQHACGVAEQLGVKSILIHPAAGVLSAYGMGLANMTVTHQEMLRQCLPAATEALPEVLARLSESSRAALVAQNVDPDVVQLNGFLHVKYAGSDSVIELAYCEDAAAIERDFLQRHQQRYGFILTDKPIEIFMMSVEAVGMVGESIDQAGTSAAHEAPKPIGQTPLYLQGQWCDADVYQRETLGYGAEIVGPAMIVEATGTNIIETDWVAVVDAAGALILKQSEAVRKAVLQKSQDYHQADPILLEVFNNLFMSIAEEMGETLSQTAFSVNIKERKDYSCAIFNQQGRLVANAPHVPIHLGSMSASVEEVIKQRAGTMQPGDAFCINDPYHGGTHLPDVTVITPVFYADNPEPQFYVGSRGHHADIGGIAPGSMPSHSVHIDEEGVLFTNFHLVKAGVFQEEAFTEALLGAQYPARNTFQNIADIQAQVAANQKGANELNRKIEEYGLAYIQAYMQHVQDNAEQAVRSLIGQLQPGQWTYPLDIGAEIVVTITPDPERGEATIDFTGTSQQGRHNYNAPKAITMAAILYAFRCMVKEKIPLNYGCLKPLKVIIPDGCILDPHYPSAVVAGNVETSQGVIDSVFSALGVVAQSQGTTNSFTYGNDDFQYYEAIAGGAGAGPGFDGASGVQTHITNTPLTDPEILETRFPVILEEFSLRYGSGGKGEFSGGDGVVRKTRFLVDTTTNILSNNRLQGPAGLNGGANGLPGRNAVLRQDGKIEELKASDTAKLLPGEVFILETPGGGGFGEIS